jgi:hypothetical protein
MAIVGADLTKTLLIAVPSLILDVVTAHPERTEN